MKQRKIIEVGTIKNTAAFAIVFLSWLPTGAQNLIRYVQPLSGTASSTTIAALKHSEAGSEQNANTIPAVTLPFAMTQFTPQTRVTENKCIPPYFYKDSLFTGVRATHWISGSCTQDYGSFTVMPVVGQLKTTVADYAVPFSHNNETAGPAYYKLVLPNRNLVTEITATTRCGMIRFTMLRDDSLYILITPNSDYATCFTKLDTITNEVTATNTVHRIYQGWGNKAGFDGCAYFKANKKIIASGSYTGNIVMDIDSVSNKKEAGVYMGFYLKKGESVELAVATSFSSIEGAKRNYIEEIGNKDFDAVHKNANQVWETALQQIQVETGNEKDKRIFYTALYHAMQHPRLMSDADGTYPKFSGNYELKKITGGNYYDDFSMWDIYRAQLPLVEILNPGLSRSIGTVHHCERGAGRLVAHISLLEQLYCSNDRRPCNCIHCIGLQ
jgi:predicted alpha-1,2-mannosidase